MSRISRAFFACIFFSWRSDSVHRRERGIQFLFVIVGIVPHGTVNVDFFLKVFFRCGLEVGTKLALQRLARNVLPPPPPQGGEGGGGGHSILSQLFFIVKKKIVWCLMKVTKLET